MLLSFLEKNLTFTEMFFTFSEKGRVVIRNNDFLFLFTELFFFTNLLLISFIQIHKHDYIKKINFKTAKFIISILLIKYLLL